MGNNVVQSIHMIAAGMTEDQIVHGQNFATAQQRRDNPFAHVEQRIVGKPASIDQEGLATGKFDQCCTTLPDIQYGDA